MPKTIVVCCDGTWNDPSSGTNIWRIFDFLCRRLIEPERATNGWDGAAYSGRDAAGQEWALFYDRGVGSDLGQRLLGGIAGRGLMGNVLQAYAFLARTWAPGDQLFCFGFSRGAFTVRSVCGLVGAAGLVTMASDEAIEAATRLYRLPRRNRRELPELEALERHERRRVRVRFLGVFDTVGALGVPAPRLDFLNRVLAPVVRFHDTGLGAHIDDACQALAIDERRGTFTPALWSSAPKLAQRCPDGRPRRLLQVWFSGAHGDVGGGYADEERALADITLDWMLRRAIEAGLPVPLEDGVWSDELDLNPFGPRHNSSRGLWKWLSGGSSAASGSLVGKLAPAPLRLFLQGLGVLHSVVQVRDHERPLVGEAPADPHSWSVPVGVKVHESVLSRYGAKSLPKVVQAALDAGLSVFKERPSRRPADATDSATLDGRPCELVDWSEAGARIKGATWPRVGADHPFTSSRHSTMRARVVWASGQEAGLELLAADAPLRVVEASSAA